MSHPLVLFDADIPGETERTVEAGADTMRLCAEAGGSLSGEHGIGMELFSRKGSAIG